ncbi:MAG: ATP-binding cassette domain-containing protein [Verrucomicrobiae bacterium]|nr:ATP-binding cassette domain-containing protein [Verrucomicrobiae bacterium]
MTDKSEAEPCLAISVRGLRVETEGHDGPRALLDDVSFALPHGHLAAVIGPSGCGKSTLLRSLAGILTPAAGEVSFFNCPASAYRETQPLAIGYLPQFSEAHESLTVEEILGFCVDLQLPDALAFSTRVRWLEYLIELAGLESVRHQRYGSLSGGQRRRVALAETLVADPPILLVDELTSGLDPHAEADMMEWLRFLTTKASKTVLLVTHSVRHLDRVDSVLFMKEGRLWYHGTFADLKKRKREGVIEDLFQMDDLSEIQHSSPFLESNAAPEGAFSVRSSRPASSLRQFFVLLRRQMLLFVRDKALIALQLALLFTFPALVAVFALDGLPQVRNLPLQLDTNIIRSLQEQLLYLRDSMSSATLVSGLIMFQVILLTLAGSNDSAREIAKESAILDKERRCGLSAWAYVGAKFTLVAMLCLAQALWMTWFVKVVCRFPGAFGAQFAILFLTTLAMGATCLAISASSRSAERASLLSIYLVGLQLPLSGAVLALPDWLVWITRPWIAAYWGWSGYLKTLSDCAVYDVVRQGTHTWLASTRMAGGVLALHCIVALGLCALLVQRRSKVPQ